MDKNKIGYEKQNPYKTKITLFVQLSQIKVQILSRLALDEHKSVDELLDDAIDCYLKADPE
jgi:hypothetical protein